MSKKIALDTKREILNFYKSKPMTLKELALNFNYSIPTVSHILNEFRFKRYSKVELFSPELNQNYFDNIDTEEKAYFLGLIITDGCIYKKNSKQNLVNITLKKQDKYLLYKFIKELNSNKKPSSDGRGCYGINILSNKLVKSLEKFGVKERKSNSTIFPKFLPKEMYRHLLRGIIDGDGNVAFNNRLNRKVHKKALRICQGNYDFLQDIVDFLSNEIGINKVKIYKEQDNLWSINYTRNNDLIRLYNYIYRDVKIYMHRKKEIFDKIINEIMFYQGNTEVTIV